MSTDRSQCDQERFWIEYYDRIAASSPEWLDYGNERVYKQTLDLAMRASAPLVGMRCLDMGCGRGQLAIALSKSGASMVTGCDASSALVDILRQEQPEVRWIHCSVCSDALPEILPLRFDRVFAVEILQYVPLDEALSSLWRLTAPGGRLVGVVPNRECPFLATAIDRFRGYYNPPTAAMLVDVIHRLEQVESRTLQALSYTQDSNALPYRVSAFENDSSSMEPPNRLLFRISKSPD